MESAVKSSEYQSVGAPARAQGYDAVIRSTGLLVALIIVGGVLSGAYATVNPAVGALASIVASVVALALSLWAIFDTKRIKGIAIAFAVCEGVALGGFSVVLAMDAGTSSIIGSAIVATMVTFVACYIVYAQKIIKVTSKFRAFVGIATLSVFAIYMLEFVLSLAGHGMGLHNNILVNIVVIVVASMMLIVDFDDAKSLAESEDASEANVWRVPLNLAISLVWLYIEFLKLFANLEKR